MKCRPSFVDLRKRLGFNEPKLESAAEPLMRYLTLFVFCTLAWSQTRDTASLLGNVSDTQGAAIVGAPVTLTNTSTGQVRTVVTDDSGRYKFSLLRVGTYQLAVEQPSFRRYEHTGIVLQANENVKLDISLELGDVKSTVTVNAAANQVETEVATLKETVDQKMVHETTMSGSLWMADKTWTTTTT